ncbi:hypothetical protein [Epilithonimonas xixisoli]|uniref:Lipoprotein n=1 Tax=Epilithonimonas xixisoli TaxID=1476462 RepID=A0A4V3H2T8_9FLAO|nr:hypothetical protein [Epilithonimonas xixisoli]TDX86431.1 hypothetical protein B0I22_0556 [Epilithonimonas xixisoli]
MMNYKTLFLLPLLLLMSNCKTQSQTHTQTSDSKTISIEINKKITIPNSKISLEFKEIVEDSRCPVDVTCVWEGIAIVNIDATNGNQKTNFKISNQNLEDKNITRSVTVSGYKITWQQLKPQPGGKEEPTVVTLKYEKE